METRSGEAARAHGKASIWLRRPYTVYLNLPDPYASLQRDPRYSFRCANTDVWDARTGYNQLTDGVTIHDPSQTAKREGPGRGR